jgi:hypothetical protein
VAELIRGGGVSMLTLTARLCWLAGVLAGHPDWHSALPRPRRGRATGTAAPAGHHSGTAPTSELAHVRRMCAQWQLLLGLPSVACGAASQQSWMALSALVCERMQRKPRTGGLPCACRCVWLSLTA